MRRTAVEKAEFIDKEYREYLRSSYSFGNDKYQDLYEKRLNEEELYKGPFLHMSMPFKKGRSLNQLIDKNIVDSDFRKLGNIHLNRTLYLHQEKSIVKIADKRNIVVTTGTGSGKTECFLYPIINEIMKEKRNGNKEPGIRAMFLYPMNALVNDQIDRLREILSSYPEITYGSFTGDTPENYKDGGTREKFAENNGIASLLDNELVTREEMRKNPPSLLFTNYSMLEYMLIRPKDSVLFNPENLNNWRFIVLDEAHTYGGALGIELSMLLKRVTGFAKTKPNFILTSATLGEKNKSDKDIVSFAKKLTSVDYDTSDIIYADRLSFSNEVRKYALDGKDISLIKNSLNNETELGNVLSKYASISGNDAKEKLYNFLEGEYNTWMVYSNLMNGPKNFRDLAKKFEPKINSKQLSDLIDIINFAEKDGMGLFELKYHSFVRALSGAYVTFGKNPDLTLIKKNYLNGMKAFEVGNCRYCNATYVIGKIVTGNENGLNYLIQNDEVDIYDNYGDEESVYVDYFLTEKPSVGLDDAEDDTKYEEYTVCAKCGCIHKTANLNARICDCGQEYSFNLYKVEEKSKKSAANNINTCLSCGHRNKNGIVKTVSVGKDEGTALIGQILYDAIDEGENTSTKKSSGGLNFSKKKIEKIVPKTKQFLCFSDSRQQASFASVFMDSNQTRLIQKRLLLKLLEENNYQDIAVNNAASLLKKEIENKHLFEGDMDAEKNAWICILKELLLVDGRYSAEGLGLLYFDLNIDDILNDTSEEEINEMFKGFNINRISKKEFHDLVEMILLAFRTTPAIDYSCSPLTTEEKVDHLDYRRFNNYISLQEVKGNGKKKSYIRSLLPINEKENTVVEYVSKALNCEVDIAKNIIFSIFTAFEETGVFQKKDNEEIYQIQAGKYVLKSGRDKKFYVCPVCGRVTPYNVNNACFTKGCKGELMEIDPDEYFTNNYYRKQYQTKKIERIVIQEHTAQIERKVAKQYQKDFKEKKINILSCSTTFEMGVDIGDLETVYMRNVPPTPANYVQRAGRAGRRKDSSAFVLTYCSAKSHDYTYFDDPTKMIAGIIQPPHFDVANEKIVLRHLVAASFGFFFKKQPEYFDSIKALVFGNGIQVYKEYLDGKPNDLGEYIDNKLLYDVKLDYKNYKWVVDKDFLDKLNYFVSDIQNNIKELENCKEEASKNDEFKAADSYKKQIDAIMNSKVIDDLSKYSIIPKYGFPVDVVNLDVYENGYKRHDKDLSRDLRIAISEYAPDSEVIVDGKKYTSRYINLPKQSEFVKHYYEICPDCGRVNISLTQYGLSKCNHCGGELHFSQEPECFVVPEYGFKTGPNKEGTRIKPKRSYSGEVAYVGGNTVKKRSNLRQITIESTSDDELFVRNKSNFYYCPECGYAELKKNYSVPKIEKEHKNYRDFKCNNQTLYKIQLGHKFKTDVTRFIIPILHSYEENRYKALSFLYAFLEGISEAFNIERNDIDGLVEKNMDSDTIDILIFDNVPGGAGHSKRLLNQDELIRALRMAYKKVNQNCCDENTSCYNCLRNYYNQQYHKYLRRKDAKDIIEQIFEKLNIPLEE